MTRFGPGAVVRDHDAFAGRQSIGFDDDGISAPAQHSFSFGGGRHGIERRCWNLVLREEPLGEHLAALEPRVPHRWANDSFPGGPESIHEPPDQQRFRADDGQIDIPLDGESHESRYCVVPNADAFGFLSDPGIPRRCNDVRYRFTPAQSPGERVLAAARAYH
jgi:hypothetical protein